MEAPNPQPQPRPRTQLTYIACPTTHDLNSLPIPSHLPHPPFINPPSGFRSVPFTGGNKRAIAYSSASPPWLQERCPVVPYRSKQLPT